MPLTVKIEVEGHTESDLQEAIELIAKQVGKGFRGGHDGNDTGNYHYDVTGEPVHHYRVVRKNGKLTPPRYMSRGEALEAAGKLAVVGRAEYQLKSDEP